MFYYPDPKKEADNSYNKCTEKITCLLQRESQGYRKKDSIAHSRRAEEQKGKRPQNERSGGWVGGGELEIINLLVLLVRFL